MSDAIDHVLESCPACAEPLNVTDFEPFTKVICPNCESETRVKRQLGKYHLDRRHARGGMSVVYVATDTTLDREVAIKVLNESYSADEKRVSAFESEARSTAAVNHPNVVRIFTVGRDFDRFYLVMELIEGQNFEIMMSQRGALPEDEVLDIALQVAQGLKAANNSGVLHRDVKPGNILFNKEGSAKLVDFGLALITQGESAQAEEVWATPYYVPPEALEKAEEDLRSDIYAFGATLYHALYGKPPFESTSNATKVLRRAKQTIPRLKKAAPWLSEETCETVDRMMAYQPKHRWNSYEELIAALKDARNVAGGEQAIHSKKRAQRRSKKSPLLIACAALAVAALLGAAIFFTVSKKDDIEKQQIVDAKPTEIEPTGQAGETGRWINDAWATAHESIAAGDYSKGHAQLMALAGDSNIPEPTQLFTQTEALLSLYLNGQPGAARAKAQRLVNRVQAIENPSPSFNKLRRLAELLSELQPPEKSDFVESPNDLSDSIGNLALALKLWEQGEHSQSATELRKARQNVITEDHPWFEIYQKIIDSYLDEEERLVSINQAPYPTHKKESEAQLAQVKQALSQVKTQGRMSYTLQALFIYLTRIRRGFELRPYDLPRFDWEALVSLMKTRSADFRFAEAKGLLMNSAAQERPEALAAWVYLLDHASLFLADIETDKELKLPLKEGGEISLSADQPIVWALLEPSGLIETHRKLTEQNSNLVDKNRMKQNEIAFIWLSGQTDIAENIAEELAKEDEVFRAKWREVVIGLSQ